MRSIKEARKPLMPASPRDASSPTPHNQWLRIEALCGAPHNRYLSRYTHRVAIGNRRLVSVADDAVTFKTRDGGLAVCSPLDFIGRFLQHVLPPGFVKIRHYGLMASSNATTKLKRARELLGGPAAESDNATSDAYPEAADYAAMLLALFGLDVAVCPRCHQRARYRTALPSERAPPPEPLAHVA